MKGTCGNYDDQRKAYAVCGELTLCETSCAIKTLGKKSRKERLPSGGSDVKKIRGIDFDHHHPLSRVHGGLDEYGFVLCCCPIIL